MTALTLGQRTKRAIEDTGISPRILSAVTKIHYTTIYSIIRAKPRGKNPNPLTVDVLDKTLTDLERLIAEGKLPFDDGMPHHKRTEALVKLLAE